MAIMATETIKSIRWQFHDPVPGHKTRCLAFIKQLLLVAWRPLLSGCASMQSAHTMLQESGKTFATGPLLPGLFGDLGSAAQPHSEVSSPAELNCMDDIQCTALC